MAGREEVSQVCRLHSTVAAYRVVGATYPTSPPYSPGVAYPEYKFDDLVTSNNDAYDLVRSALGGLGLDPSHIGQAKWNPLRGVVKPGDRVLVKPNLLYQSHKYRRDEWHQVITHGAVVRAVLDYVLSALGGSGRVWVADGPQYDADWGLILERTGLQVVCEWLTARSAVPIDLLDLREKHLDCRGDVKYGETELRGDPLGCVTVNLGCRSRLYGHAGEGHYHGSDYDRSETNRHHVGCLQDYSLSATAASADVLINVPKLKTHKKVGVTLSLKNMVGVVGSNRNWLPHYSVGEPGDGGDQFPERSMRVRAEGAGVAWLQGFTERHRWFASGFRGLKAIARPLFGHTESTIRSGNWPGNDTCWRMVHDVNRALLYYGHNGLAAETPKRYLTVIDGIAAGEGNGPEAPQAMTAGVVVAATNALAADCVSAKLMGFEPARIPLLAHGFDESDLPFADFSYSDIVVRSNRREWHKALTDIDSEDCLHLVPHFAWTGAIESRSRERSLRHEAR